MAEKTCDVVVIGAGITGLLTARALQRLGKDVVVLERRRIASGTTGYSTAHVTALLDTGYATVEKKFGREAAHLVAGCLTKAIDDLCAAADRVSVPCERLPVYHFAHAEEARERIADELAAADRAGLSVQLAADIPFPGADHGGLRVPRQAQLDPMELCCALALDFSPRGGRIFEDARVVYVEDGEPCRVETAHGRVRARDIVLATHTPIGLSFLHTEVAPYRSYVIAARCEKPIGHGLFFDTDEPYRYIRAVSAKDPGMLLIGGADHKTGDSASADEFEHLEGFATERLGAGSPRFRWSAQLYEPVDTLPYIGRSSRGGHSYVATGYAGDGIIFASVAARLISAGITGKVLPEAELMSPSRITPIASAKNFIRENADVARHFVGDRLSLAEQRDLEDLRRGEGRLVQLGMRKVAAYRDGDGQLHVVRPVCTHMKCIVHFNPVETTWDCPCHGGRFDVDGEPIEGPPLASLMPFELPNRIGPEPATVNPILPNSPATSS
jgi:glycine/D-amino acid oxidase-like deaminating enzyme/nitrite reductase/ring-hydroxylating ferredoxin subunit